MNNLSVTKSNNLIDASYRLNAQAQKLILACIGKVNSKTQIPDRISLTASEFSELTGISMKNAHRELYKAADSLWDATITLSDENETTRIRWVDKDIKKHKGEGAVTIFWTRDILKYISQLKNRFTTYKLRNIAHLQSSHSIRVYELLMKFSSTGQRVIYLDDFKDSLGISGKYPTFKALNRDVVKPAIKELNDRSDLVVTCETVKKGRSVVALSFEFKQNPQPQLDFGL